MEHYDQLLVLDTCGGGRAQDAACYDGAWATHPSNKTSTWDTASGAWVAAGPAPRWTDPLNRNQSGLCSTVDGVYVCFPVCVPADGWTRAGGLGQLVPGLPNGGRPHLGPPQGAGSGCGGVSGHYR